MKKFMAKIIFTCLSILTISYILFYTAPGLNLSLSLVSRFLPGTLQYTSITGSWYSPITIKKLSYTDQNISFHSNKITLRIHLLDLINKKIRMDNFTADNSTLKIKKGKNTSTNDPLDNLKLSWSFDCPKVLFRYFSIQYQKNKPAKIDHLHGHVVILNNRYDLDLTGKSPQHGHVNLIFQGSPNQYKFNSQWHQQQFAVSLNGFGDTQNVSFYGNLKYQSHQAKLNGSYQFKTAIAKLKSNYTNLKLQSFIPTLQAQISGSTLLTINLKNLNLNLSTKNYTKKNSIELNVEHQQKNWNAKWKIHANQLKSINKRITGDITSTGSASIKNNQINTSGSASINQLSFNGIQTNKAQFHWEIQNNANSKSNIVGHIGHLQLHNVNLLNTKISLTGSRQQHQLSLQSKINQLPIILKSQGSMAHNQFQETLTYLHISPAGLKPLSIKEPSKISFTLKTFNIPNLCLTNKHNQLCFSIKLNKNQQWSIHAKLNSIHIDPWAKLLNIPLHSNSHINMQLQARGQNKKLFDTQATGELTQGAIHINANAKQIIFPINSVKFNLLHTKNNNTLNLQALFPQKNTISTNLIFQPFYSLNNILTTPLSGELKINFQNLSALPSITPWFNIIHGKLFSHFKISGTMLKPSLTGTLNLTPTNLKLPIVGNTIEHIQAKMVGSNHQLQAKITLSNHKKQIICHTNTELTPPFNTTAILTSNNFNIINTPEYNVFISPKLNININQHRAIINGHILIPKANIKPILSKGLVSIPEEDIIYSKNARQTHFPIETHITASLGKKVSISALGITGFLRGQLQISGINIDQLTGNGALHLVDGVIHSYSHVLNITPSSGLFFYNTPITRPILNLTATRMVNTVNTTNSSAIMTNKIMVGIKLHGKIHHPNLSLFSSPASLSQSEILSYLLLGNSSSINTDSMGQNLFSALTAIELTETSIGGKNNEGITNKLISTFGFSEFGASSQTNTDALGNTLDDNNDPSFVIGKYFTKHLYVRFTRYNNLLQIKLILNPYWAIQASSSTLGNGVDLLYNIDS